MILGLTALILSAMMILAWGVRLKTSQSGWIDAIWSFSLGLGAGLVAWAPFDPSVVTPRQWFVGLCAFMAALRLGLDISRRTIGAGDDPRYQALIISWGVDFKTKLFWFLQIQAGCAFLLCVTIYVAAHKPQPLGASLDYIGFAVILIAFIGEMLSDRQLRQFKKQKNNKSICDTGLWSCSRHPNYFFEWLAWVGYAILAFDVSGRWSLGFLGLIGPILMYWLLVHVSGIPLLEKHMLATRPKEYLDYQQRVPAFFPKWRKSERLNLIN